VLDRKSTSESVRRPSDCDATAGLARRLPAHVVPSVEHCWVPNCSRQDKGGRQVGTPHGSTSDAKNKIMKKIVRATAPRTVSLLLFR
jgi:hypothetical protein